MTLVGSAMAANDGTITIPPPTNNPSDAQNTYTLYKVFDAVGSVSGSTASYSYKLAGNHTTAPTGFILDDGGNVYFADEATAAQIADDSVTKFTVKVGGVDKVLVYMALPYHRQRIISTEKCASHRVIASPHSQQTGVYVAT